MRVKIKGKTYQTALQMVKDYDIDIHLGLKQLSYKYDSDIRTVSNIRAGIQALLDYQRGVHDK